MHDGALDIDRVALQLHLAAAAGREHPVGARLRDAVRRALETQLPAALAALPDQDSSLVFIERVHVDCGLSAAWDEERAGAQFCAELAAALERLARDPGVVRFRDRPELVAALLAALADGAAWQRWWFDEFDGLAPLSAGNAVRTAIVDEGETGIAALTRLTGDRLRRVVATLPAADTERLLAWWAESRRAADGIELPALVEAVGRETELGPHGLLRAAVHAERARPHTVSGAALRALAALAAWTGAPDRLPERAAGCDPAAWLGECARVFGVSADWLAGCRPAEAEALAERLAELRRAEPAPRAAACFTPHGGAALLLARHAASGRWARWHAALALTPAAAVAAELAGAAALAIAASAIAPERPEAVHADAALRALAGVEADVGALLARHARILLHALTAGAEERDCSALVRGHGRLGARLDRLIAWLGARMLDEFGRALPGGAGSSAPYIRAQCLALPATIVCARERVEVALGRPPLDVLLKLAGQKRGDWPLPEGRRLVLRDAEAR